MVRRIVLVLVVIALLLLAPLLFADRYISSQVADSWTRDIGQLPQRPVALVLGTSKYVGKRLNAYYQFRVEAAAKLYHQHKVDALILSGDNATRYYNEPVTMLNDVLAMEVPRKHIALDYAGFRTLDSVVRAQQVFGQDALVIVSQQFHVERALYIAKNYGIDAVGYVVDDAPNQYHWRVRAREILARFKALIDLHLFNVQPHFLGEPELVTLRSLAEQTEPGQPLESRK